MLLNTCNLNFSIAKAILYNNTLNTLAELHKKLEVNMSNGHISGQNNLRYGYKKGIQGYNNSCYIDATIMSLFYGSEVSDNVFFKNLKTQNPTEGTVVSILRWIAGILRNQNFCPFEIVYRLRTKLAANNSKFLGDMMDVEEFICTLCGPCLKLPHFIEYSTGTSSYYHQIIVNHQKIPTDKIGRLKLLLADSLQLQGLEIRSLNAPIFLIKMPRANGRLIAYDAIIPPLTMSIPIANSNATSNSNVGVIFELQSVICLRFCHYTTFIRSNKEWVYFDSMASGGQPEVILNNPLESLLEHCQNHCDLQRTSASSKMLLQLLTDVHFCVYAAIQPKKQLGFSIQSRMQTLPFQSPSNVTRPQLNTSTIVRPRPTLPVTSPHGQNNNPYPNNYRPHASVNQSSQRIPAATYSHWSPEMHESAIAVPSRVLPISNQGNVVENLWSKFVTFMSDVQYAICTTLNWDLNTSMGKIGTNRRLLPEEAHQIERLGTNKGIRSSTETSHLAALLFVMFSNTRINDNLLKRNLIPANDTTSLIATNQLDHILNEIRLPLYVCNPEPIQKLYTLLRLNNNTTKAINRLFKDCLKADAFIKYVTGPAFVHEIRIEVGHRNKTNTFQTSENLFINSMQHQKLKLVKVPKPQLILSYESKNIGIDYIVPSLKLHLQSVIANSLPVEMDLFAIICRKSNGSCTAYVKFNADQNCDEACWIKMSPATPKITAWPNLYHHLKNSANREQINKKITSFVKDDKDFLMLCSEVHILMYK